ncbi:hypothetical protein [Embleya sp. NPDC059237]|uniref:hypothetical protein n=1 Tax=Embleya sp. NPDC059237 TaxID=3346784 RepID=UPI0036C4B90A
MLEYMFEKWSNVINMGDSDTGVDPAALDATFAGGRPSLGERVAATRARTAAGPDEAVERAILASLDLAGLAHYRNHRRLLIEHPIIAARIVRGQMLAEREALREGYRTALRNSSGVSGGSVSHAGPCPGKLTALPHFRW